MAKIAYGVGGLALAPHGIAQLASLPVDRAKWNILLILVDQWRSPVWFPDQTALDQFLPATAALRKESVQFNGYYTAATACTPARATLLTGLYAPQTAIFNTQINDQAPNLNPGFPTWGTMLRSFGYDTNWFGKWHLSNFDADQDDIPSLEPYGFGGGTFPSPNGGNGQGQQVDPSIVDQFEGWLSQTKQTPWCTTVSLINPHDIAAYYRGTNLVANENHPPAVFTSVPANFETPVELSRKPALQQRYRLLTEAALGPLPYRGPGFEAPWLKLLDTYLFCQQLVDQQINRVLGTLAQSEFAENTVVIFTSDHGEYGGSHGLRNKSGALYEESIHVPFFLRLPGGRLAGQQRTQLCSSVDLAGLLLSLASGNNSWRKNNPQIANRLAFAEMIWDPAAPGRPFILHTTDEHYAIESLGTSVYDASIATHAIGLRSTEAKLGLYSFWKDGTIEIAPNNHELEFYDYSTDGGRLETASTTFTPLAQKYLDWLVSSVIPGELRATLPESLQPVQQTAIQNYLSYVEPRAV